MDLGIYIKSLGIPWSFTCCERTVQQFKGKVPGVKVKAVDTTGAGDAFVGGILNSLATDFYLHEVSGPCMNLRVYAAYLLF